ncbi:uncharacterized protein LOC143282641 [Babylonia areolata]|uniref:uncharacterized protein LOC143282641 n=1 Tax=Babylonia areolata TaxID=304850 RepID=UPI003FD0A201
MPLLHGKGTQPHHCGKCKEDIPTWDGIFCDECAEWFHVKCDQLEIQHQEAFRELPEAPYICRSCRSDDKGAFSYARSLERLRKGAKQDFEKLLICVERERQFVKEDVSFSSARSPKYTVDASSEALLRDYCNSQKRNAAKVTRDGNSLFAAVSLALVGTEKLALELRVRCCIEMVVYETFYKFQENYMNLLRCAPDYIESCLNCAMPGEDSCVWTMSALASVVRRNIESIYPSVNGKMDVAVEILNTVFYPRCKGEEGESLKIFWGGSRRSDQALGSWVPEVFVPLVDIPLVPMSPVVLSPYLTPSRVSGRVRKPTAKVLAITNPKIKTEMKVVVENTPEDDGDADFAMPSDFTLEPTDEDIFQVKYRPEKIDLHWMDKYTHIAEGGKPLKGTAFLPAQEVFHELTTTTELCPSIPAGRKEDVFFVVDNSRNLRYKHRRNYFQDDCGRYNQRSGTTCKSFYLLSTNNMLQQLIKDKGKYCKESKRVAASPSDSPRGGKGRPPSRNRGRGRGGLAERKVTKWIPMDPQPEEDQVVVLHRYYSSLDIDPTYKRRISWFSNLPDRLEAGHRSFLVEYITKPIAGLMLPESRKGGLCTPPEVDSSYDADAAEVVRLVEQAEDTEASSSQAEDAENTDHAAMDTSMEDVDKEAGKEAAFEANAASEEQEMDSQVTVVKTEVTGDPVVQDEASVTEEVTEIAESGNVGNEFHIQDAAAVQASGSQTLTQT